MLGSPDFVARAQTVKAIIFDVDGIFTDGYIYVDDHGDEIKAFSVLDGQGIKWLQQVGIQIAIISGREAPGVRFRMEALGIAAVMLGCPDKLAVYQQLLQDWQLTDKQIAYVGDDLPDLPVLLRVGLPITVPNAVTVVKDRLPWQTRAKGGKGAVREICENILRAQGEWEKILRFYGGDANAGD